MRFELSCHGRSEVEVLVFQNILAFVAACEPVLKSFSMLLLQEGSNSGKEEKSCSPPSMKDCLELVSLHVDTGIFDRVFSLPSQCKTPSPIKCQSRSVLHMNSEENKKPAQVRHPNAKFSPKGYCS